MAQWTFGPFVERGRPGGEDAVSRSTQGRVDPWGPGPSPPLASGVPRDPSLHQQGPPCAHGAAGSARAAAAAGFGRTPGALVGRSSALGAVSASLHPHARQRRICLCGQLLADELGRFVTLSVPRVEAPALSLLSPHPLRHPRHGSATESPPAGPAGRQGLAGQRLPLGRDGRGGLGRLRGTAFPAGTSRTSGGCTRP